jgi:hypothetical protein
MSEYLERPSINKPVFGDFVVLEMQRHRVANEYYIHEVLSQQFYSNYWRDVPIVSSQKETLHKTTEAVISVRSSSGLPIFNVRVCDILPMVGDKWCWKESPLRTCITELEAAQRWIPVGERLPEDTERMLTIVYDAFEDTTAISILQHYGDGDWFSWDSGRYVVTHWMPLPESPNDTQTQAIVYGKDCD